MLFCFPSDWSIIKSLKRKDTVVVTFIFCFITHYFFHFYIWSLFFTSNFFVIFVVQIRSSFDRTLFFKEKTKGILCFSEVSFINIFPVLWQKETSWHVTVVRLTSTRFTETISYFFPTSSLVNVKTIIDANSLYLSISSTL